MRRTGREAHWSKEPLQGKAFCVTFTHKPNENTSLHKHYFGFLHEGQVFVTHSSNEVHVKGLPGQTKVSHDGERLPHQEQHESWKAFFEAKKNVAGRQFEFSGLAVEK